MKWLKAATVAIILFAGVGNVKGVVYYTVKDLGTFGGNNSAAWSVANNGLVVGWSDNSSNQQRAFVYDNGVTTDLGTLAQGATVARDVNQAGQITGSSLVDNAYRAYLYENGTMTSLGTLPGDFDSYGRAINNSGQVAGISRDFSFNSRAVLYDNGTVTNLGALPGDAQSRAYGINNAGQVVGISYNFRESAHAFLYDNGVMTDLGTLGGAASYARGINDNGQVVGSSYNADNLRRAFLHENGVMSDLGTLGGWNSHARDINNNGDVVGTSETAIAGVYHSFLYSNGAMADLKSLIDPASRWDLRYADSINDSGTIVGQGRTPGGEWHGFLMTPITRTDASLALPAVYSGLRMMENSSQSAGKVDMTIEAAGNTTTSYGLASANLSLTPTAGTLAPAAVQAVPVTFGWADTSTVGARTGSILLTNDDDPADPANHTMNVSGAVLADRVLNAAPLGTPGSPLRIMAKAALTTTLSSGNNPAVDSDDAATRVATVAGARIRSGAATVTYAATQPGGALLPRFDGVGQSANVAVTFASPGHYSSTVDLAPVTLANGRVSEGLIGDGEAAAVGADVQSTNLSYDVNVLEARKLRATGSHLDFGNVLRGAPIAAHFVVTSGNRDPSFNSTTMVNVAAGGTALGDLTAQQTLVAGGGSVPVPLGGTLNTYGKANVRGSLPVTSAEAPSVQDTSSYRDLTVRYKANVGIAKLGRSPTAFGSGETVLSATVAVGQKLTNLSSKVDPRRTLAADLTPASSVVGVTSLSSRTLYGTVGSEAEIVTSSPLANNTMVNMQWRKRQPGEAHMLNVPAPTLPSGDWLASDVVKISGIDPGLTYALQMSFDNRINLAFDGPVQGTIANEFPGLYLVQFNTTANQWVNAATSGAIGGSAQQGVFQSLAGFLATNSLVSLSDLQGSWGVDPVASLTGTGHSWAIVASGGSGIFAVDPSHSINLTAGGLSNVVPEPSGIVLLLIALAGLVGYSLCRYRRLKLMLCKQPRANPIVR